MGLISRVSSRTYRYIYEMICKIIPFMLTVCALNNPYPQNNVLGRALEICSTDPMTGYTRDGRCAHIEEDMGTHTVCAEVTEEFLEYTASMGNNLSRPAPQYGFPGLRPGDHWCLCASRWLQAVQNGVAPGVVLAATNESTLRLGISGDILREYGLDRDRYSSVCYDNSTRFE